MAQRLENGEITVRNITVVNEDDELEIDEKGQVGTLIQQLLLVYDDFIARQMIKKSGQATKLKRFENEEIDKLSKRIHSQFQLISFNQSQIEKFTDLLLQRALKIECAIQQIAQYQESQGMGSKKVFKLIQCLLAARKAEDKSKVATLRLEIENI